MKSMFHIIKLLTVIYSYGLFHLSEVFMNSKLIYFDFKVQNKVSVNWISDRFEYQIN